MLVAALVGGIYLLWPSRQGTTVVAYFTTAVGLYPGDEVRVVGVPVGTIESIQPRAADVKVTMKLRDDVKLPADAKAIVIAPNLVAARFVQFTRRTPVALRWPTAPRWASTEPACPWSGTRSRSSSPS